MAPASFDISTHGDDTLYAELITVDSRDNVETIETVAHQLRATREWLEVVPDMAGITIQFDSFDQTHAEAQHELKRQLAMPIGDVVFQRKIVQVPICYDGDLGPDLPMLEQRLQLSREEIISRHCAAVYRVQMIGFLPGFAYCGELDKALVTPRLTSPRVKVEAGTVGIAGSQTGIYSLSCPGGWPLIGRTPLKLFDTARDNPFLLSAGTKICFHRVNEIEFEALYRENHL